MQKPTLNRITQGQHLTSKAVDYAAGPDSTAYAPEDAIIESYGQRGTPGTKDDAGNALRFKGATGLHQFAHLEKSYVKAGDKVKRGQPLAKMGYTGYTIPKGPGGAHLHYWVQTPRGYVYPEQLYNEPFIKLGDEVMITKEMEMALSYLSTGAYPGKDYNYKFVGTSDVNGMITFWSSQQTKINKEMEQTLAQIATGSNYGTGYNSPYQGKPLALSSEVQKMLNFWKTQRTESGFEQVKESLYKKK